MQETGTLTCLIDMRTVAYHLCIVVQLQGLHLRQCFYPCSTQITPFLFNVGRGCWSCGHIPGQCCCQFHQFRGYCCACPDSGSLRVWCWLPVLPLIVEAGSDSGLDSKDTRSVTKYGVGQTFFRGCSLCGMFMGGTQAQCACSATTWVSRRTGNPYFVILWASLLCDSRF